jgi:hypothetical protein
VPASEDFTPLDTLKRYLSLPRRTIEEGLSSLATLPQRAFQASEQMRTEGPYDPGPAVEAALTTMGTGAMAGVKAAPGEAVLGAGPIRAYHSSPHDFDKFDLAKIGTGEGAQVYGHGLYFAENPAVSGQGGQYWNQFMRRFKGEEEAAARRLQMSGFDREAAARLTQEAKDRYVTEPSKYLDAATVAQRQADLQRQHELLTSGKPVGPRTYEVNINADPAHMLDWDKPLGEQAIAGKLPSKLLDPARAEAYERYHAARTPQQEEQLWSMVQNHLKMPGRFLVEGGGKPSSVSAALNEAGIPGIKYLDQGSRGAGTGSSNYVVFNPGIIDIMKKYGLAGLAPAGIGAKAAAEWYPPNPGSQP